MKKSEKLQSVILRKIKGKQVSFSIDEKGKLIEWKGEIPEPTIEELNSWEEEFNIAEDIALDKKLKKEEILAQYSIEDQLNIMREAILTGDNLKLIEIDNLIKNVCHNQCTKS